MKTVALKPGPRYDSLIQVLKTAELLWDVSRRFFEQWDLSPSQFNVLRALREEGAGLSQVELSRRLVMHRSNVTGLIDRLEARGLVARKASPTDRRSWTLFLTPEADTLLQSILPRYYQVAEEAWGDTPVENARQIAEGLRDLGDRADALVATLTAPPQ